MSAIAHTNLVPTDLTTFDKTYQVREGITVTVEQRRYAQGSFDEARAVFSQRTHDVVLMVHDLFQIARICGQPQPGEVVRNFMFVPQKSGGGDFAQDDSFKEYKLRDCGWKTNLWVYDNTKLELDHKYGKGESWNRITLEIGDVLAALALIDIAATEAQIAELALDLTDLCNPCNVCQRPPEIKPTIKGLLKSNPHLGPYTVMCPSCTQYVVAEYSTSQPTPHTEANHRQAMQDAVTSWNNA